MIKKFFITGTDTGIGKTYISCRLLEYYNHKGFRTIGLKPVGTGGFIEDNKIINEDAVLLRDHSSVKLDLDKVNPFSFLPPVSPHIAFDKLASAIIYKKVIKIIDENKADIYVIEGAGGWHAPINYHETMENLAIKLKVPVIFVVGIKLGCLSHAILTYDAIKRSKLPIHAWVANIIDPSMIAIEKNIEFLKRYIEEPLLVL